ncbi:C-lysozyme inhibitor [Paracoccus limosus]|uniref:C-lysozyme inhibitor n=1 Tax=Paracoccus limosus TaxID=913252 RepID=A0A844H2I2_9RHOB|nr:Ivy family c-type lysozyme inhibitor [Paracoccus limosus]MTH35086.1 C-lysozyme inhibitor [Paracoccus limosus]
MNGNRVKLSMIGALMALMAAIPAMAEDSPPELPTLEQLDKDTSMTAAFDAMTVNRTMPEWLKNGGVTTPTQQVGFDGKSWLAMSSCKPHDCASQRIAVIYEPKSNVMYGLLSETSNDGAEEKLSWLNMGGGAETIDGRTILYAALTGSLQNHPKGFDYNEN